MIDTTTYLGPGTYLRARKNRIRVRLDSGEEVAARVAFVMPYQPNEGDQLLVQTQDGETYFAIGVLERASQTTLQFSRAVEIHAPGGIHLRSDRAIEGEAPRVTLRAGKLELLARRVHQRVEDLFQWVTGLFQTKSRSMTTEVETQLHVKANESYLLAENDMNIDGKTVNLG